MNFDIVQSNKSSYGQKDWKWAYKSKQANIKAVIMGEKKLCIIITNVSTSQISTNLVLIWGKKVEQLDERQ